MNNSNTPADEAFMALWLADYESGEHDANAPISVNGTAAQAQTGPQDQPPPTPEGEGHTDLYFDVGALLDGGIPEPPAPVLLQRTDGHAIFYAASVNMIFGDPETGKTLLAQAAAAEAMKDGRSAFHVDIDHNGEAAIVARYLEMGVPAEVLRDRTRFRVVAPEDRDHLMSVIKDAVRWRPYVSTLDSVGELLPRMGLNSNSADDFTIASNAVLVPLARAGSAVFAIDHLSRNYESRASGPTGTMAKRRAISGTGIRVTLAERFVPGRGGAAHLTINKDRHGGLRQHCPPATGQQEQKVGTFRIDSRGGGIRWAIHPPRDEALPPAADPGAASPDVGAGWPQRVWDTYAVIREAPQPITVDEIRELLPRSPKGQPPAVRTVQDSVSTLIHASMVVAAGKRNKNPIYASTHTAGAEDAA